MMLVRIMRSGMKTFAGLEMVLTEANFFDH